MSRNLLRKSAAEAIGTFVIVFSGCGFLAGADRFHGQASAAPAVFGLAVAAMVYAVGHISGAHFNPAVTLAFAVVRRFPAREVPAYWGAQFLGAVAAAGSLLPLLPEGAVFGQTAPAVAPLMGFAWEAILTFILMFVIVAVATDARAEGTMAGAAIGAAVMLGAWVGGPVTGASMNPARTLGPALVSGEGRAIWIYFAGPAVGAVLAALAYERVRCDDRIKDPKGCC